MLQNTKFKKNKLTYLQKIYAPDNMEIMKRINQI